MYLRAAISISKYELPSKLLVPGALHGIRPEPEAGRFRADQLNTAPMAEAGEPQGNAPEEI